MSSIRLSVQGQSIDRGGIQACGRGLGRIAGIGGEDLVAAVEERSSGLAEPPGCGIAAGDGEHAGGELWRLRPWRGASLAPRASDESSIALDFRCRAHERVSQIPELSRCGSRRPSRRRRARGRSGAPEAGGERGCHGGGGALGNRAAGDRTEERLARKSDQHRHTQGGKTFEVSQDLEIVLEPSCRSRCRGRRRCGREGCRARSAHSTRNARKSYTSVTTSR